MKHVSWIFSALLLLFVCGCAVDNNYLRPEDFAEYLRRDGTVVYRVVGFI